MAEQVKLLGSFRSPYSFRVELALKLKGVEYEFIEEDLSNKSADLLKYNPVHKKIPVFVHNGKAIAESSLIVEYIDEAFTGPSILPEDPYEKANARFLAKFIDDKLQHARTGVVGKGEEKEKAKQEMNVLLETLEKQLEGKKYFGGDKIGLVDISASFIGYWLGIFEELMGVEIMKRDKFPNLTQWIDDFVGCNTVKECLPPRDKILASFRARFKNYIQ